MRIPLLLLALALPSPAQERPNILWITSEDNSSHWIGCYGNKQAETPRIDALAKEGVLFKNAYSNAPVCAVARATILTGAYSPTMGTQHMRSRHAIPEKFRPNVEYLRAAGYHCTNNNKTDYNFKGKATLFAAHRKRDNKSGQLITCERAVDIERFERLFEPS
jgi:arylsulfatase A-like enzyme